MKRNTAKRNQRMRRHTRIRSKICGTVDRPRLSVFRSNRHITAQLLDDVHGKTLAYATDQIKGVKAKKTAKKETPVTRAIAVGEQIAKLATDINISTIVFDRGGYRYHGRVKALAEGARKGGMKF